MAYPTSLDSFPSVIADGTVVSAEAHVVASGASTFTLGLNKPTGWQIIAKGAFPLPAPGGSTLTGQLGGSLTTLGVYKYVVTFVTQYGETTAGTEVTITLTGSQNAVALTAIPTGGTSTNPVLGRKIYRTASGGAAASEKLVGFIDDNSETTFIDTLADLDLPAIPPPGSNGSGLQLVTIPGFTEVVSSPAAGQFSVDYSYTSTGGTVSINSATSQTVNVSYTGGHLANAPLFNSLITAINSLESHAVQLSPATQQTGTINLSGIIATQGGLPSNSVTLAQFGAKRWYLAQTVGDDVSCGQFDYRGLDATALSIVGAGTAAGNRKILLWDNVAIPGTLTVTLAAVLSNTASVAGILSLAGGLPSNSTSTAQLGATRWFMAQTGGDNVSSGQFDYRGIDATALSIVGAGTSGVNHKINLYDNVATAGTLTSGGAFSVLAGGAAITGNSTITGTLTAAGARVNGGRTAPLLTALATSAALGPATPNGTWNNIASEAYSFTTSQPGSTVLVNITIPINRNTISADLKFDLLFTAVPAGSIVSLGELGPQFGMSRTASAASYVAEGIMAFVADKAGTYTLQVRYVTTNSSTGSFTYNETLSFAGVSTSHGQILFTELPS